MPLFRLIYTSRAAGRTSEADLKAIVDKARANNARSNVTGMLLFDRGCFLQVLEGNEADITAAFNRIRADPRHLCVERLLHAPAKRRLFKGWRMGLAKLDASRPLSGKPLASLLSIAHELARQDSEKAVPEILRQFLQRTELQRAA